MLVDIFKPLESEDGNLSITVLETVNDTYLVLEELDGIDICWEYETLPETLHHYIEFVETHKDEFVL